MPEMTIRRKWAIAILLLGTVALSLAWMLYARVRRGALDLPSGMLLLGVIGLSAVVAWEIIVWTRRTTPHLRTNMRLLIGITTLLLVAVELFLRFGLATYASYPELMGEPRYYPPYHLPQATWFLVHQPGQELVVNTPEFTYTRRINSLGLAEREVDTAVAVNEFKIVALGDSFTEGFGAGYDSSWVRVMERQLADHFPDRRITAVNAGISGSDVWFEYVLLHERLVMLQPDLVIVDLNSTDVNDVIMRGGEERFRPDGTMVPAKRAPWWVGLYGISYITRHIVHDVLAFNLFLMKEDVMVLEQQRAGRSIVAGIEAFRQLAEARGFQLVIVFHPGQWELAMREYGEIHPVVETLKSSVDVAVIDLLEYYRARDLLMPDSLAKFFWSIDTHHNAAGYDVMGKAIASEIVRMRLVDGSRVAGR